MIAGTGSSEPEPMKSSSKPSAAHLTAALFVFFVSGFAALVYEVLWMKELGILFGNTEQFLLT